MGLEVFIEDDARKYVEKLGGVMRKWVSPGTKGVPDRIVSYFVCGPFAMEFKAPGEKLKPHQQSECKILAANGWRVYAGNDWWGVNSIKMAHEIIDDEFNGVHPSLRRHQPVNADA